MTRALIPGLAAVVLAGTALAQPAPVAAPSAPEVAQGQAHDEKGLHQRQDAEPAQPQGAAGADEPAAAPVVQRAPGRVAAQPQTDVVTPGPQRDAGRGQDKDQKGAEAKKWLDELHGSDWIQIVSNLCLIVANIALFWATWRTAKSAQTSADAALRQAEVMASAEAPVVRVTRVRIGGQGLVGLDGRPHIPDMPVLILDLVNGGRSPATVTAFGFDRVVRNGPPPAVREASPLPIRRDIYLLPGERHEFYDLDTPMEISGQDRNAMMQAFEKLWVWGFVEFEDNLGTTRRQRFFVRVDIDVNQDGTLFRMLPLRPPPIA